MKRGFGRYLLGAGLAFSAIGPSAYGSFVRINEFVTDPQQDHNGSGTITDSDEFFELYSSSDKPIDLTGWRLDLIDNTPASHNLEGIIGSRGYVVSINPTGSQTNDGRIELYDENNSLVHGISYGNFDDGNILDNLPSGNATGLHDESLSAYLDGSNSYMKTPATPGYANVPEPTTLTLLGLGIIGLGSKLKRKFGR